MSIVRIKKIDGRPERLNAGKLNRLFLRAVYSERSTVELKLRNEIFNVSESIIKKANDKFSDTLVPYETWEKWFLNKLEKLSEELFGLWNNFYVKADFQDGHYVEPTWNVISKDEEDEDTFNNDFQELNFFLDEILSDTKPGKNKKSKNQKKTRMPDMLRSVWIEWMTTLSVDTLDENSISVKTNAIKELNTLFSNFNNEVFIKKTSQDWYVWFYSLLPLMDKNPKLHIIARRLAYGLIKSSPETWLDNTPMAMRLKASFSLDRGGYGKSESDHANIADPVWNSRSDLFIADSFPVRTLFFIYGNKKPFKSLEDKLKIAFKHNDKLKALAIKNIVTCDPLLLANECQLDQMNYISNHLLKGNYSDVELTWHTVGNELRKGQHVNVDVSPLVPEQWFQIQYAELVRQTRLYGTYLTVMIDHKHPYMDRILSPSLGGFGWLADLSKENDSEKLQRWLKASSQNKVAIEVNEIKTKNFFVLGFRFDLFIQLELTERERVLSEISRWSYDKNIILNILGLNQALKTYDQNKAKDVKTSSSYKDWLADSLNYIRDVIKRDSDKDFSFGFLSSESWSSYDYLNVANIDNEKTLRSVANLLIFLNKNGLNSIIDLGISNTSMFTLSMFEKVKSAGVHQFFKLTESDATKFHIKA